MKTSLERFMEYEGHLENDPVERLRFFCSIAMDVQDWVDLEMFIEDILNERDGNVNQDSN